MSQPGPPWIEAEGLTKRFGSFTAVDHVSFRIEKGEIFGFLGSNGCGKSTTMKMLTGLLPATEGKATLLGQPVDGQSIETRQRIGYMSQAFSLYGELTVQQISSSTPSCSTCLRPSKVLAWRKCSSGSG